MAVGRCWRSVYIRPFGGRHRKNTYASETPATDGERLYVYFGDVGLFAYSFEGELEWEHRFAPQPIYLDFVGEPTLEQHESAARSARARNEPR